MLGLTNRAMAWRVLGSLVTFLLVWGVSGSLGLAVAVTAVEILVKWLLSLFFFRRGEAAGSPPEPADSSKASPFVLWFTGLSGAGKTTIARAVEAALRERGLDVAWLDGDVTREFLPQTGFSKAERNQHVIRSGFIARMLETHGVPVIASYIAPYEQARDQVRAMCRNYIEVYVSTPIEVCEGRDVKGLYAKARNGEITQFTGIDDPYEAPTRAELNIDTSTCTIEEARDRVLAYLAQHNLA